MNSYLWSTMHDVIRTLCDMTGRNGTTKYALLIEWS